MCMSYKILGWFSVIMGVLAVLGSLDPIDGNGLFGGTMFASTGFAILDLLKKKK